MSTQFNCKKTFLFQTIQFDQTVLIQLIKFSISTDFDYTQLNQFSVNTVLKQFYFKLFSLAYARSLNVSTV